MKVTIDKKNSGLEFIGWHELAIIFWYSGTSIDSPCHEEERKMQSIFIGGGMEERGESKMQRKVR